ncbi:methyltransferase domain-containing protein [Kitasatospora cineracea]|uniref:methyltransferase domain-containing protein n=1 Tax=Kitasatospora cineracea TaxID=88074 RepID=UPI00341D62BF
MRERERAEAGRGRLASVLLGSGALTPDWLAAYHAVPRHLFVPDTVWPGRADGVRQGGAVRRAGDPDGWWDAVYRDVPLTTQWDDGAYSGDAPGRVPSSSSSMPGMVFSMLAALEVSVGERVLEIGTGTGWNAALLAHRLGSANVTTVEVDAATAAAARHRLARAGYAPVAVVGDGERGHPPGAPFDRVLATCSVRRVPYAWVAQCRPGGLVVAPWGPEYGGEAVVKLTVRQDGTAEGRFVRSSAFMRLRAQRPARPDSLRYLSAPWPADGTASTTPLSPEQLGGWAAMFALGVRLPGVFPLVERYPDGSYTLWLHDTAVTSWATADWEPGRTEFAVVQSGPRRLWDEAERAWHWWDASGRPGFERFGLTVGPEHCTVWLDAPDRPVPQEG